MLRVRLRAYWSSWLPVGAACRPGRHRQTQAGQLLDHLATITGSCADLVRGSGLGLAVGHASTVRPDPSTLARRENEAPTTRVARDLSRHAAAIGPTMGSG
jgi:hypothetical protein